MKEVSQKQSEANRQHTQNIVPVGKEKELQTQSEIENMRNYFTNLGFADDEKRLEEYFELKRTKHKTEEQKSRKSDLFRELVILHGFENGMLTANLSYSQYYGLLSKMRQDIIKEYNCKTSLEFMLADRIVASYWRAMKYDTALNRLIEKEDGSFSFDQLKINAIKEVDKGIELADRQLNANIILLKELKQPLLNVRVKTDNAYIAQNQQVINTGQNTPQDAKGEIISDK